LVGADEMSDVKKLHHCTGNEREIISTKKDEITNEKRLATSIYMSRFGNTKWIIYSSPIDRSVSFLAYRRS
jgi:hypothetical protein